MGCYVRVVFVYHRELQDFKIPHFEYSLLSSIWKIEYLKSKWRGIRKAFSFSM